MSDSINIIDSLPWFISIPLGFVTMKYVNLSNRQTKTETIVAQLQKDRIELCAKLDSVVKAIQDNTVQTSNLIGRFDEHLRRI